MEAPSASNVCDPEFDERGPLLGEVIKLEKTIGDIDGQQRTIIKLELATLTGDEDPRCFKNVYRLQPLNHLHFSAAGRQSVTISQELDHANINSAGLSEHNAAVNESTKTTPPMNTQEAAPSTEQEETLSPKAGNMPPSSSLLGPPHGETQVSSSCTPPRDGIEAPSQPASLLVQNPSPLAQLERQKSLGPDSTLWEGLLLRSPLIRQPPTPAPPSRQLVFSSIAEGSRPLSASFEQPSSPALVATEGSPLRTYPPSPTLTVPKSPSPSSSLTVQQPPLPEKETPPSPSPSLTPHQPHSSERETPLIRAPSPTVRTPPSHLPSTRSSAASGGNDAHLAYLSPSPHQQIAPSLSPQTCKTPALAELEGSLQSSSLPNPPSQQGHAPDRTEGTISPLFTVPEDETSQAPLCPQQAVSPVECPIPASRPMTQLSPHFEAHLSFEALLATTPQQNSARITRSSQKRTVPPLVSEDTGFMDQTGYAELKGTKRKRGVSRKKDSVDQTKRTRNERNDDLSATGHIGAEQRCSDDGIEDPAVTMDALAKKFSAAIRLGGQVSQEPGGQTLPIHLTEPTRSHSTTLEALLEQQKAHAGALTSSATIANMTYQWCLIGGEYKSKFIGSSRWSNGRNEARLRRSGQWIICIVNHVYSGLRARVSAGGHGDGALDAYKIPAALAAASSADSDAVPFQSSYRDYSSKNRGIVAELIAQDLTENADQSWRAIGPEFALDPAAKITTCDFSYEEARAALGLQADPLNPRQNADEELDTDATEAATMMEILEPRPEDSAYEELNTEANEGALGTIETSSTPATPPWLYWPLNPQFDLVDGATGAMENVDGTVLFDCYDVYDAGPFNDIPALRP